MDDLSHDRITRETPEAGTPDAKNTLDTLDERSYSSGAAVPLEQVERINGKPIDITNVEGNTPEEKIANLQREAEKSPEAHLILRREVGSFHAEVRRGWNEEEQKQYESIMVRDATKTVEIPGFGETTLTNIRVGKNEGPKENVPYWGSAEFHELNIKRPAEETYAALLEEARTELKQKQGHEKIQKTFEFDGHTVTLEVSNDPADKVTWENQDFHMYTDIPFEDNPEVFRAVLPSLSLGRHEPDERPLAGYAMSLRNVSVDLSKTKGTIGRAFFTYQLIDRSEVSQGEQDKNNAPTA